MPQYIEENDIKINNDPMGRYIQKKKEERKKKKGKRLSFTRPG